MSGAEPPSPLSPLRASQLPRICEAREQRVRLLVENTIIQDKLRLVGDETTKIWATALARVNAAPLSILFVGVPTMSFRCIGLEKQNIERVNPAEH